MQAIKKHFINRAMPKISTDRLKKIDPKLLMKLINKAKKFLKNNDVFVEMCKERDISTDVLDLIPIRFGDIDVSAKTNHGIIILNYKLLSDGDFFKDYSYILHEVSHYLSQCYGDKPTQGADDGEYLDNLEEQEAFKYQIQYLDDMYGENEANRYVEHLLDHHSIDNAEEREEKKEILKEKIK